MASFGKGESKQAEKAEPVKSLSDKDLNEFHDYFQQQEGEQAAPGPNHALLAGIGLILVDILRALRGSEGR
jgi:hypothetical protein